jgi:serine protease Do
MYIFLPTRSVVLVCFLLSSPAFAQRAWHTDYAAAKAEAARTGKPLFVTFRCDPCPETRKFERQVTALAKPWGDVADQFVRVRLTRIQGADLSLFEFDYDLTWAAFFLNADEVVYGRYGGRDATSDDGHLSLAGLKYAADRALERHKDVPKRPAPRGKPDLVEEYPAARARKRNDCIHCHQVNLFRRSAAPWDREDRWVYPLPETVGLTLDVDRGDTVKAVAAGSPAAKLKLKVGDVLTKLNELPVASIADVQFALNRAPKAGAIPIEWTSGTNSMEGKLTVAAGWRKTDLTWRASLSELLPTLHLSGADLSAAEKKALGLSDANAAVRQDKFVHSTLKTAGLLRDDVIVGVNGKPVPGGMDDLTGYVRREFMAGDVVGLDVIREGKPVVVKVTLK